MMVALFRYHLRRVFTPALWIVLLTILAYILFAYRAGGEWMGQAFGYRTVLQLWQIVSTLFTIFLVLTTPPARARTIESDPIYLTRPTVSYIIRDRLTRFVALMLPLILVGTLLSIYMMSRIPDAAKMYYPDLFTDPLTVFAIWQVFVLGPIPGIALLFALADLLSTVFWSPILRVIFVCVVTITDAINRLSTPWLSPSGTALSIIQKRTNLSQPCLAIVDPSWSDGSFCTQNAMWGDYLFAQSGGALLGPVTTDVAIVLVVARVSIGLIAIGIVIGTAWWYHRNLQLHI